MTHASLNFVHNDDLFIVTVDNGEVSRVIQRSSTGQLIMDVLNYDHVPVHLQIVIDNKLNDHHEH